MIGDKGHLGHNTSIIKEQFENINYQVDPVLWHPIVATADQIPGNLKEWRMWRDLTLKQVEFLTGVSNAYISQVENGKIARPSFDVIVKLCKVYQVKLII